MTTYIFPNFYDPNTGVEIDITDPIIEVCERTIMLNSIDKLFDATIKIITTDSKIKGFRLREIPYTGNWDDVDVHNLVLEKLEYYKQD